MEYNKTYFRELQEKYPNRRWITKPTWELKNMKKALSTLRALNAPNQKARLKEVTEELKLRRNKK